ncbi:hypothetical protein A9798_08420 [Edwardsiella hoshinae]|uniref:DoxX n=1 Tax=Edwardsiella hoshinae TaxID=93378 RepID=A0A376DF02_9GAMM|nr:DoxX family protein [Edwardsiella hoshinae]AOV96986.1 hypothetical protein A9798_08420 [Edwardsiella hoshinae]QPR27162.1 DoxX family protein [Edwardsiella hoshinae]STC88302.1 Uncharacterised protein [Edwardsiella hoshinae]
MESRLRAILLVIFFFSGLAKLAALPFEMVAFERWGYGVKGMYLVGVAEWCAAVGLLLPRLRRVAAMGLALLMLGALQTQLRHGEGDMALLAVLLLLALLLTAWQPAGKAYGSVDGRRPR